jgi:hypothetical protein
MPLSPFAWRAPLCLLAPAQLCTRFFCGVLQGRLPELISFWNDISLFVKSNQHNALLQAVDSSDDMMDSFAHKLVASGSTMQPTGKALGFFFAGGLPLPSSP